jgi:glucoside 3-dehydrogenase (cytochrome c) hitch-hiker subunit
MQRRDVIRLLAGATALPLLSRDALALFRATYQEMPATAALKTLNAHQNATVIAMSETIIPQTKTPGAKAARVNEFIDVILTDWYDSSERSRFLTGLEDVDVRSTKLCNQKFVDCAAEQQLAVMKSLDEEAGALHVAANAPSNSRNEPAPNFFLMMKQLTIVGYYTSQMGFEEELHEQIIPPAHDACAPLEEEATN